MQQRGRTFHGSPRSHSQGFGLALFGEPCHDGGSSGVEVREARGVGPNRNLICLHLDHLPPETLCRALAWNLGDSEDLCWRGRHGGASTVHHDRVGIPTQFVSDNLASGEARCAMRLSAKFAFRWPT